MMRERISTWWWGLRAGVRRGIRGSLLFIALGIIAITVGITTASYHGSLGPHSADYSMTANGEVRVDLGPLGALIMDSPIPVLGILVQVGEIPSELGIGTDSLLTDLSADFNSYLQFFSHPAAALEQARDGLIFDALHRIVLIWSLLMGLVALARLMAHGVLRAAALSAWGRPGVPVLSMTLVAVLVLTIGQAVRASSPLEGHKTAVLAGTPLQDARITGRLGEIIDYYGNELLNLVEENDAFYQKARLGVLQAYSATSDPAIPRHLLMQPATRVLLAEQEIEKQETEDAQDPEKLQDPEAPHDPEPPGDSEAPQEPSTYPAGAPIGYQTDAEPDGVNLVIVSDLHCNMGMAEVIRAIADSSEAELILNLGDTVMSGTEVESVCVDAFARAWQGIPVVVADGNHDSVLTSQQETDAGWQVLAGEPIEVAGIRFLGDTDPMLTGIGVPTHQEREETVLEMGERLAAQACELAQTGEPVDILAVHQPYAGRQTLEQGCAPLSMSGHLHSQSGPWQRGWGWQYISSTSGGAQASLQIGPLTSEAVVTQLRWDRANHVPIGYRLIRIDAAAEVKLSPWYEFPPAPEYSVEPSVPADLDNPWG